MSFKDIADLCHSLSLEDNEEPVKKLNICLKEIGARKLALCLVGKLFSNKRFRLPEFCFRCGFIGHPLRDCIEEHEESQCEGLEGLRFGGWLRAGSPPRVSGKSSRTDNYSTGRAALSPATATVDTPMLHNTHKFSDQDAHASILTGHNVHTEKAPLVANSTGREKVIKEESREVTGDTRVNPALKLLKVFELSDRRRGEGLSQVGSDEGFKRQVSNGVMVGKNGVVLHGLGVDGNLSSAGNNTSDHVDLFHIGGVIGQEGVDADTVVLG
ncbi:hypothetical protein ACOSQ3_012362 [Xanthoceras sorbifolium]